MCWNIPLVGFARLNLEPPTFPTTGCFFRVPHRPLFTAIELAGNDVTLRFTGESGQVQGTGGEVSFTDSSGAGQTQAYYRVQVALAS